MENEQKEFSCPHCGGTAGVRLAANCTKDIELISADGEKPARAEILQTDLEYDVCSCSECGENVALPEWARLSVYRADKQKAETGNVRFADSVCEGMHDKA